MEGLQGLRILVVEDELLVALGLQDMLRDFGCETIGPVARIEEAVAVARSEAFDGAILDVNLRGQPVNPVAAALHERNIPFLFSTGYGTGSAVLETFAGVAVLEKPYEPAGLHAAMLQAFGRRDGQARGGRAAPDRS